MADDMSEYEHTSEEDDSDQPGTDNVESSEGQSSERMPRSRQPSSRKASKSKHNRSGASKPRKKVDTMVANDYRQLLNSVTVEVNGDLSALEPSLDSSQIGASFWTSQEKHALFLSLSRRGPGDLPSLCRAVPTKSEYETRMYLRMLQESVAASHRPGSEKRDTALRELPAAIEISEECEGALDVVATQLESLANEHDSHLEQQKYGENWLVDADFAEEEELQYKQSSDESGNLSEGPRDGPAGLAEPRLTENTAKSDQASLLRPALLLQLSRTLFMNNGEHEELNWRQIESISKDADEPAMYKSAFSDLHNIIVNMTRRLIQASIFQVMTRLRAGDASRTDWTPVAAIREVDVRSALEILGMEPKWHHYWATVNRRCKVAAYSESKKYKDGRLGTKAGYELSYDEAEAELGIEKADVDEEEDDPIFDTDVDDFMQDEELFTDEEEERSIGKENEESDDEVPTRKNTPKKRRRALSPASFCRAEEAYLEAIDQQAKAEEESNLYGMLRLPVPKDAAEAQDAQPQHPGARPEYENGVSAWRNHVEYEAHWERPFGVPKPADFRAMGHRGQLGRKRRKVLEQKVREILEAQSLPESKKCGAEATVDDEDEEEKMSIDESKEEEEDDPEIEPSEGSGDEDEAASESGLEETHQSNDETDRESEDDRKTE